MNACIGDLEVYLVFIVKVGLFTTNALDEDTERSHSAIFHSYKLSTQITLEIFTCYLRDYRKSALITCTGMYRTNLRNMTLDMSNYV